MPPEILSRIFTFLHIRTIKFFPPLEREELNQVKPTSAVLTVSHACSYWRSITLASSGFPRQLFLPQLLQNGVHRYRAHLLGRPASFSLDLYLDFDDMTMDTAMIKRGPGRLIEKIARNHGIQLQSLSVMGRPSQRGALWKLFHTLRAPALRYLSLDLSPYSDEDIGDRSMLSTRALPSTFSHTATPFLERLYLKEVFPSPEHRFDKLTHLCIHITQDIDVFRGFTIEGLSQSVLKASQGTLEYLFLVIDAWTKDRTTKDDPPHAPVFLSKLRIAMFREEGNAFPWINCLLAHIRLPPTCVLQIAPLPAAYRYPAIPCSYVAMPHTAVLRRAPTSDEIYLTPVTFHEGHIHVVESIELPSVIERLQNYMGSVETMYISTRFLAKNRWMSMRELWISIMNYVPKVKEIIFRDLGVDSDPISKYSTTSSPFRGAPVLKSLYELTPEDGAPSGGLLSSRIYLPPMVSTGLTPSESDLVSKYGREGDNLIGTITVTVGNNPPDAPSDPFASMLAERELDLSEAASMLLRPQRRGAH